jgi:NADH-quinone oxidoreductase subunit J
VTFPFIILAILTLTSAVAAMSLRNLVHCALSLVVTLVGLAALFLRLHAEFVGFAQILVYVGAVAILVVFAILLTRSSESSRPVPLPITSATWWGVAAAGGVFLTIASAVLATSWVHDDALAVPAASVRVIGEKLMSDFVVPLEVVGLLLTAAMIGAAIIALQEPKK